MKNFLTILLLASAIVAVVEENQAAPNVLESQKSGITITTDKGQAIKVNTDGPVPIVTSSHHRFSRKNVGLSGPHGFVSRRRMDDSNNDGQSGASSEQTPTAEAQEEELMDAIKLLGRLKRLRKAQDGDSVTLDGAIVDEIIEKLEGYEETLQEIIAEAEEESSSSSSSSTSNYQGHQNDGGNDEDNKRKRSLKSSSHHRFSHFRHSRLNRASHSSKWVIKP